MRVIQVMRPAAGGMREHVRLLSVQLVRRQWQVTIAAPELVEVASATHVPLDLSARPSVVADVRAARRLRAVCSGAQLVHAHGYRAGWVCALAAGRLPPVVMTAHNLPTITARWSLRWVARKARAVIAVSEAVRMAVIACGADRETIFVVPNGIDLARFATLPARDAARRSLGIADGDRTIVSVGRLAWEKGFDALLRAARLLRHEMPDVRVIIVGDGPERTRLEDLSARLRLASTVRFAGRVDDVLPWLRSADVVVAPSRSEGQGIAVLEAMAAGRPVVASAVGGLRETVEHGVTGLLTRPGDPRDLASALRRVLMDPHALQAMGDAARRRALERYSLDAMVDAVERVYCQCVSSPSRASGGA